MPRVQSEQYISSIDADNDSDIHILLLFIMCLDYEFQKFIYIKNANSKINHI